MRVLVAYASKGGSTKGIAEFIGNQLQGQGVFAEVRDVKSIPEVGGYDAFVIGSAVYIGHWLKEAKEFVSRNRDLFLGKPVWLFSSGPTGTKKTDSQGRDLREVSGPTEIADLKEWTNPQDHKVFFGAIFADRLTGATGFTYRLFRRSKTIADASPDGDFRDWSEIEAWARSIARVLSPPAAVARDG